MTEHSENSADRPGARGWLASLRARLAKLLRWLLGTLAVVAVVGLLIWQWPLVRGLMGPSGPEDVAALDEARPGAPAVNLPLSPPDAPKGTIEQRLARLEAVQELDAERLQSQLEALRREWWRQADSAAAPGRAWLAAQARFLLLLSYRTLSLPEREGLSRILMEGADHLIGSLEDPATAQVRQALARDLLELEGVQTLDRQAVFFRIQAIQSEVGELHARMSFAAAREREDLNAQAASSVWGVLRRVVIVRHDGKDLEPLPSASGELLLRRRMELALEQAQLALLSGQEQVYREALAEVAGRLERHYLPYNQDAQNLIGQLRRLAQLKIQAPNPDSYRSLRALDSYLQGLRLPGGN